METFYAKYFFKSLVEHLGIFQLKSYCEIGGIAVNSRSFNFTSIIPIQCYLSVNKSYNFVRYDRVCMVFRFILVFLYTDF